MNWRMRGGRDSSSTAGLPRTAGFAALAGSLGALYGPFLPGNTVAAAAAVIAALLASGVSRRPVLGRRRRGILAAFACGALVSGIAAVLVLAGRWPASLDGSKAMVEACVVSVPVPAGGSVDFDADLRLREPGGMRGARLRARLAWSEPSRLPGAGECWQLVVRLRSPRAALNPGAVDRERLWFRDGVQALGSVVPGPWNRPTDARTAFVDGLRQAVVESIREQVPDRDAAALFAALAVGVTASMSDEQWRVFAATGTTHLVAISGLHVTMFAALTVALTRRAWRLTGLSRCCDRDALAAGLGIVAALGYAVLAGLSVPTLRTVAMLAVWWLARLSGRVSGPLEILGLALLVVLAIDPLAPLSAGFWLSFLAVAVLLLGEGVVAGRGPLRELLSSQWRIGVAMLPLTLGLFGRAALAGTFGNLAAIPVFTLLLVPLVLVASALLAIDASLARWPLVLAAGIYRLAWPLLERLADSPLAMVSAAPGPAALALLAAGAACFILPLPVAVRLLGLLAIGAGLAPVASGLGTGQYRAWVLDAGEGLAVVVRTQAHTIVIGTGDVYGSEGRRALQWLRPALDVAAARRVDLLVLPRGTRDELDGVARLATERPVRRVEIGGGSAPAGSPLAACPALAHRSWDGVLVTVMALAPGPGGVARCAVRIAGRAGALLVLGRVPSVAPGALPLVAQVVVLQGVAATRGAAAAWVAATGPADIVVAGGHASPDRLARLARLWGVDRTRLHAVAQSGAIEIDARGRAGIRIRPVERAGSPLWRAARSP